MVHTKRSPAPTLNASCEALFLDCGDIWQKRRFALEGTELLSELNAKLFAIELELMDWALRREHES